MPSACPTPPGPRRPPWRAACAAAALLASAATCAADPIFGVIDGPLDLLAAVTQATNPGGTVFSDGMHATGTLGGAKQTAEYLYLAPALGINLSGRSPNISSAFASSLAESDGNGGVGVSAFIFGRPPGGGTTGTHELVSQAVWSQTFEHTGGAPAANVSLHLAIPALELGLQGVAPNRSSISKTESAQATATLTTFITRAGGSQTTVDSFLYGLKAEEFQILLGPNVYANFAGVTPIGNFSNTIVEGGDSFDPTWTLAPFSADVRLGTLNAGDTLTYVYTLEARGTSNGGERGFAAFIGDPFGVDIVAGNLQPEITLAVPEPASWLLGAGGLALLAWRRGRVR
jgi:hypothetical protein